jgi:NADH:ubiquinone oxidoreductase subunit D
MADLAGTLRGHGKLDLQAEPVILNIGPSHPATHATLRFIAELDGETILSLTPEFGYLHRCFEKESESHTWTQVVTYTDRLNYVSPDEQRGVRDGRGEAVRHRGHRAVQVHPGAHLRASRIIDHMVCIGTNMVDLGPSRTSGTSGSRAKRSTCT